MRNLALAITIAIAGAVAAQADDTKLLHDVFAMELDTVVVDCPDYLQQWQNTEELVGALYCSTMNANLDLAKMRVERFVRDFNDIRWIDPWHGDEELITRRFTIEGRDLAWAVIVDASDRRVLLALAEWLRN